MNLCVGDVYILLCATYPSKDLASWSQFSWWYCVQGIAFSIVFGRVNTHWEAMYLTLQNWGLQKIGCWSSLFFWSCSECPNREKVGELRGNHNSKWLSGVLSLNLILWASFSVIKLFCTNILVMELSVVLQRYLWYIGHSWSWAEAGRFRELQPTVLCRCQLLQAGGKTETWTAADWNAWRWQGSAQSSRARSVGWQSGTGGWVARSGQDHPRLDREDLWWGITAERSPGEESPDRLAWLPLK